MGVAYPSLVRFSLYQEKLVSVTMELEVPKGIFSSLHEPLPWSNGFCGDKVNRGSLVSKVNGPWQKIVVLILL